MSLIITLFVREGIVLASDSRITLNTQQQESAGSPMVQYLAVSQSDSNNKTFLAPNNIGISTCGAADIQGVPIAGFIESFINEHLENANPSIEVDQLPTLLLNHFRSLPGPPATTFHVAGYKNEQGKLVQHIYNVDVAAASISRINLSGGNGTGEQGVTWAGESDILFRLTNALYEQKQGNYIQLPTFQIPFQFFTLQDAIDFAVYGISATIDSMRFMTRPKTVGGPIDVLIIKPKGAEWVRKKELHVP